MDKVVFCSGKVFFDIDKELETNQPTGKVMVIRLEELAPFPANLIEEQISKVGKNASVYYVQNECMNQGAF